MIIKSIDHYRIGAGDKKFIYRIISILIKYLSRYISERALLAGVA